MKIRLLGILITVAALVGACSKDEDTPYVPVVYPYASGAFIANEGTFGQDNASVSFYSYAGDSLEQDIFSRANGRPLGKLLQSIHLSAGKAYLVLNMSDTVVVVNANDFKQTGLITGLSSPRYMTTYNGKGYITQWGGGGAVQVADLATGAITHTIKTGMGPEMALTLNNQVLVCNGGAYDVDSTVTVIDPVENKVVSTIEVGHNPKEMVADMQGNVWVLCYGYIKYDGSFNIILETPSKLVKLSGNPLQVTGSYIIAEKQHPQHIDISKDKSTVFYGGGFGFNGIYAMDIHATATPATPLIDGAKSFYGFNVNPQTGDIFAFDAVDFTSAGKMFRYTSDGVLVKEYATGVAPNGAWFR